MRRVDDGDHKGGNCEVEMGARTGLAQGDWEINEMEAWERSKRAIISESTQETKHGTAGSLVAETPARREKARAMQSGHMTFS